MKVYICNYDYWENNYGPVLRVMCRKVETHERVILDIQDERLTPVMYILKSDFPLVKKVLEEYNTWKYVVRYEDSIETEYSEETVALYTKYPRHVNYIKRHLDGILTFQADIKWEKKVTQQLQWKLVLEVKDYDEWSFTPIDNITPTDEIVETNFNICYWDIETNGSKTRGRQFADCRFAHKIPIISYVTYGKHAKHFTYYGFKPEWEEEEYWTEIETELGEKALSMSIFKDYPREHKLLVKRFNSEKEMHKAFIEDFSKGEYDGIMTFNGRGGNRIIPAKGGKHKRQWFTGFDMPMFVERCKHFELWEELQKMSPIPVGRNWRGKIAAPSLTMYVKYNDKKIETGREYRIKGVPQHDLFFDNYVLKYTKGHNKMKRRNLETFLRYFLGFGKISHTGLSVWELFKVNEDKELRYNFVDVEGMFALDMYFGYINDVSLRALAYGGKIEDGVYASRLHDHIKLWKINREYLLPSRPEYGKETARPDQWPGMIGEKVGGFNLDVTTGIYGYEDDKIGFIVDFAKLYPSCSRSVNADTRTKINLDHIEIDQNGIHLVDNRDERFHWNDVTRNPAGFFRKDLISIDTVIYDELIELRNNYKKKKVHYEILANKTDDKELREEYLNMAKTFNAIQFSYKGLINGKFGATGMIGSRSFDYVVYNTPPAMGQLMIKETIRLMKLKGYDAIFASTDSAMGVCKSTDPHEAWEEVQELVKWLNKELHEYQIREFNIIKDYNHLTCEKIFRPWILFDMRRYAANVIMAEDGGEVIEYNRVKPYWRGVELVRKNSSEFTYDMQNTIFNMLFDRAPEEEVFKYIRKLDREFESYEWQYIAEKCGISKDVNSSNSQSYVACRNANKYLGKNYDAGVTPYLGIFASGGYPHTIKNSSKIGFSRGNPSQYEVIKPDKQNGELVVAFDEDDEWQMKKLGFKLDYIKYKKKVFIDKVEPILELIFNENYKSITKSKATLWEV